MAALDLAITGLSAGYPHKPVIEHLTLDPVRAGALSVLVGPNGAGKSTLLRAIAGLIPARGSVRVGGTELIDASVRTRAARIAFMPQSLPQRVGLTVLEGMMSALRASPVEDVDLTASRVLHDRVMATLDRVGIAGLAMEPLDHLSGGERQLASLAQAIVREPKVLLLDEPTSALDLRHQVSVMGLVRQLAADGRIVVAVLHDLNLAAAWADHVVVLNRGALDCAGPPASAITPDVLARVYGVHAHVDQDARGRARVTVDGLVER